MNASKLGLSLTSSVLATALVLAPINGALAAPPDGGEAASEEVEAPEGEEGEEGEEGAEPAEGEEGEEGAEPAEGEEGAEGEPADGEEGVDGEEPVEEEPAVEEEEPEEEEAEAEEEEAEDEDEEVALEPVGPLRPAEPTWGPKDQYPMNGKGMLVAGGVVTGLGAAFIVTSILITRCDFDSALSCKFGDQRNFLVPTAVAATGLGLLLVGVGVGNRIKYKRWESWTPEQTAVVPTFMPGGGGGVAWVGRF